MLGYPDQAIRQLDQGLALAQDLAHPQTLAHALWFAAEVHVILREPMAVEEIIASLFPLVSKHGSAVGVANARMLHGWALVSQQQADKGLEELRIGLEAWRATGSKLFGPYRLGRAADAYREAGRIDEALRLIVEATEVMEQRGDRMFEPELCRLHGELLVSVGDQDGAEGCFRRAIAVARNQSSRLFELRSASSFSRLWRAQSQCKKARELLAPVYDWFTEGFGTADLKEAKALLDELR